MPNGYGVYGPGATPQARRTLAALPPPGKRSPDEQATQTAAAVRRVAAANGHILPKVAGPSGTSTWLIVLPLAGGILLLGAALFALLRKWLLRS